MQLNKTHDDEDGEDEEKVVFLYVCDLGGEGVLPLIGNGKHTQPGTVRHTPV